MTVVPSANSVCPANECAVEGRKPKTASRSCAQQSRGSRCVNSCCPDDSGDRGPADHRSGAVTASASGKTSRSEFYIIARLDLDDSAVDVYSRIFDAPGNGRHAGEWSRSWSLPVRPGTAADLERLDHLLAGAGYRRSSGWRKRITASGAVRYFADATASSYAGIRTR